jgi:N-acetylglutamate synthase-like GNAT family acetyltransferase
MFEPARPEDLPLLREHIQRMRLDGEGLAPEQFVLVRRDGEITAFGRIKPYRECFELGTVGVLESARGQGLGEAVVRELIRRFPVREVWITTDLPAYFERFGFVRVEDGIPPELSDKLGRICGTLRQNVGAMRLVKSDSPGAP